MCPRPNVRRKTRWPARWSVWRRAVTWYCLMGWKRQAIPIRWFVCAFKARLAREHFDIFAREYHPFQISFREVGSPFVVELSQRYFTRYITKSIFLGKPLWQTERLESYQYFTQTEFCQAIDGLGLEIRELRTLTVDEDKWNNLVEIETPGAKFPEEHILIVAQKT